MGNALTPLETLDCVRSMGYVGVPPAGFAALVSGEVPVVD